MGILVVGFPQDSYRIDWFVKAGGLLSYHGLLWIHVGETMVKATLKQCPGFQKFPQGSGFLKFPHGSGFQKFPEGNYQKMCC